MCLLDAGFMKLLCSLQAGDTAFLTGRCLLGTFRIKAAALGCGVTTWGHHKAPHLHLDSLANMKGSPPAPLSPAGLLAAIFGASCTSSYHKKQSSCRTGPSWQHRDMGPALPIVTPGWHITKISPKVGISCFILLLLNKKNTSLWYKVPVASVYGPRHVTWVPSHSWFSPTVLTSSKDSNFLRCHISTLPVQSLPPTQELRVLTPFSLTQVTKIPHYFK